MPVSQAVVICGFGELGQTVSSSQPGRVHGRYAPRPHLCCWAK